MELLDRIFSTKRKLDNEYSDSRSRARSCEIALEQVRLLLYKECDRRGRKVLFDSATINKVPANKNDKPENYQTDKIPCIVEVSEGFAYIYKGPATDTSVLGEMIFGAVAMNCKNVSLKIHIMNEPKRLLCTKVFCVPASRRVSRVDRKISEVTSCGRLGSKPLNVPLFNDNSFSFGLSLDRGDSGFCGEQSSYSSFGSTYDYFSMFDSWDGNLPEDTFHPFVGRKLSTSSCDSWQRRTFQNLSTRFDLGQNTEVLKVPTASTVNSNDSQIYSSGSTSGTSDSLASSSSVALRKSKLGLALLITVPDTADIDFIRRCVEHSPQLQALVYRLRVATLSAGAGNNFVSTLYRAAKDAARWLTDLMYGPRLQPTWLMLVASDRGHAAKIADELLTDLCSVLSVGDTKNTNFFISTLLTHVLTHHLGWVTTVSPYDTIEAKRPQETEPQRPYNALWAQLGDLCGSIGFPPKTTRTIIAGTTNVQFINRLLSVLTYFVRCGDVKRKEFEYEDCVVDDSKIVNVSRPECGLRRTATRGDLDRDFSLRVPSVNTGSSGSSVSTLLASDVSLKKSTTSANLSCKLSTTSDIESGIEKPMSSQLRRNPTVMISLQDSDSSSNSSLSEEPDKAVVFVLGDDDKLVGLKNKSNGGKCVKKSSKGQKEQVNLELPENLDSKDGTLDREQPNNPENPSQCCRQTLQHSKPIKHSGFKFEFDKYPQIVTNYMKSKNLEILDRHYIGKPGNLKLDNFQFDPTVAPSIQEERCEICYQCQLMESMLQTPTNASEMECMNDLPRQSEPQFAKESIVTEEEREISPKTFVRKRKENTIIVNVKRREDMRFNGLEARLDARRVEERDRVSVKQVIEFPLPRVSPQPKSTRSGFDTTMLGGVTDHYVPELILQGTLSSPSKWETDLRRDLDLTMYLNKALDTPMQTVAIIGDTNTWDVRVVGRECGYGGLSPLVGGMLDALPIMRQAKVPPTQCLLYIESKLREFCVLSKTLADMLMSTDFIDIATLTTCLNVDVNDVPLLLAVATTHTPQIATKYGISYR